MMGTRGLERATELAILNANYMKDRLKGSFEVLFACPLFRKTSSLDLTPKTSSRKPET